MFARDLRIPRTSPDAPSSRDVPVSARIRVCPECSGPLVHGSGCLTCAQCGWGRCE